MPSEWREMSHVIKSSVQPTIEHKPLPNSDNQLDTINVCLFVAKIFFGFLFTRVYSAKHFLGIKLFGHVA